MIRFFKPFVFAVLLTFFISNCCGQARNIIIDTIRASFQKINRDQTLKKLELDNEDFLPDEQPDGGCSLTAYYKKDTIYKMTVWIGISYCVRQYEYYLENGIPFFIYETERDFPENQDGTLNHEQLSLAFEGRYYLDKGKVIDIKLKGKKRMEEQPTAVSIQSLVTDGKSYARLLSSHLKKTK